MLRVVTNPDGTKTARHALLADPVTYNPSDETVVLATLQSKAVGERVKIAEQARVGKMTNLEALARQRGADRNTINLLRQFSPIPKVEPEAHRLDSLIGDLESRKQKLPSNPMERLAKFAREIRAREQQPDPEAPPVEVTDALSKLESLKERLLFDDRERPERLVRCELAIRQLREGDTDIGLGMTFDIFDGERALAAERKTQVAMRQDELRREAASLDAYASGLAPLPVGEVAENA